MNNSKCLSIIIPHWENIDGLTYLLQSIKGENAGNNIEIIVIDDYSSKNTQNLLLEMKNNYNFKLYFNNSIKSAGTCRNIGIDKSEGDWLLFADSDDYFKPDFFNKVSKYFNSSFEIVFFEPTSCVYGTSILSNRHLNFVRYIKTYISDNNLDLLRYRWYAPWSKLIKKSFIINNGIKFDQTLTSNDIYFSILSGHLAKNIAIDKNIIYCSTERKNSLVTNPSVNHLRDRIKVLIKINKFFSKNNLKIYKVTYFKRLIAISHYGIKYFIESLIKIIINGENPFWGFSRSLHNYLKSLKK